VSKETVGNSRPEKWNTHVTDTKTSHIEEDCDQENGVSEFQTVEKTGVDLLQTLSTGGAKRQRTLSIWKRTKSYREEQDMSSDSIGKGECKLLRELSGIDRKFDVFRHECK